MFPRKKEGVENDVIGIENQGVAKGTRVDF